MPLAQRNHVAGVAVYGLQEVQRGVGIEFLGNAMRHVDAVRRGDEVFKSDVAVWHFACCAAESGRRHDGEHDVHDARDVGFGDGLYEEGHL